MWFQYAPGSGIYFNLGKTISFAEHADGYSFFQISNPPHGDWNGAMCQAAAAAGYDSLQFLAHVDHVSYQCDTSHTGTPGYDYMGLEIVATKLVGTYSCGAAAGAPAVITRGWGGSKPCDCDVRKQYLNCKGVALAGLSRATVEEKG